MEENKNLGKEDSNYEYYCTICYSVVKYTNNECKKCKSEIGSQTAIGLGFRRKEILMYPSSVMKDYRF